MALEQFSSFCELPNHVERTRSCQRPEVNLCMARTWMGDSLGIRIAVGIQLFLIHVKSNNFIMCFHGSADNEFDHD